MKEMITGAAIAIAIYALMALLAGWMLQEPVPHTAAQAQQHGKF